MVPKIAILVDQSAAPPQKTSVEAEALPALGVVDRPRAVQIVREGGGPRRPTKLEGKIAAPAQDHNLGGLK